MSAEPVTPAMGNQLNPPAEPGRSGPRTVTVVLSLLAAAVAGSAVGLVIAISGGFPGGGTPGETTAPAEPIEPASVASFDPVGGSGFRDEGGTWSTQTYKTAQFGGLKPGVGLLIDLGEAREVSSVTLETASPGLTVELLAGDDAPSTDVAGMPSADSLTTEGETVLSGAEAGAHRYWMVWVTELAPADGGFSAEVSTPVVEGPPA